jgi:uncharacterized protein YcfL
MASFFPVRLSPLAALVLFCSCAAAKPPPIDARIFLDASLEFDVQSVDLARNSSGTMNLQAVFANQSGRDQHVQYKVDWLDDAGTYSNTILSRWTPLWVTTGAPARIQATAPDPAVSDFRLQIRRNMAKGYE